MCGIGLTLLCDPACPGVESTSAPDAAGASARLHRAIADVLADRGPDLTHQHYSPPAAYAFGDGADEAESADEVEGTEWSLRRRSGPGSGAPSRGVGPWRLTLLASVLHMRGAELTGQPHVSEDEEDAFVLCWNGEVYACGPDEDDGGGDPDLASYDAAEEGGSFRSDTRDVMALLSSALREGGSRRFDGVGSHETVARAMSRIHGEYSFILYHNQKSTQRESVYFGRDPLGRRSLLLSKTDDGAVDSLAEVILTSTAFDTGERERTFDEIEAGKVFCLDLRTGTATARPLPRPAPSLPLGVAHDAAYARTLGAEGVSAALVRASETLEALLSRAVRRRVVTAPPPRRGDAAVGVLFSGGLDSVVLAALSHAHVPPDQPIDLLTVAFSSAKHPISSSPDRAAALASWRELAERWPAREWRLVAVDVPYAEVQRHERRLCRLMAPRDSAMDFNIATAFWFASRGRGVVVDPVCAAEGAGSPAPPPRVAMGPADAAPADATPAETGAATMDAFPPARTPYTSRARVLLLGIGADEQLGGYGRHRAVYKRGGYPALREELRMERARIWTRNLGRDDRVVADHGKEARLPFLDDDVGDFLRALDVEDACDMERPPGEGDKMILRLLAKRLGVAECSGLVKRAIQFGSRIAKCSDVERFGSSRKAQGHSLHRHGPAPGEE